MNQNVTASFGLSVLIVVFFAVVLYQPDPPTPLPKPEGQASASVRSESPPAVEPVAAPPSPVVEATAPAPEPVPLPTTPVVAPVAVRPRERVATEVPVTRRPSPPGTGAVTASAARSGDGAVTRVAARRPAPAVAEREPRGAFTLARAGESLTDVANRVYGSADSAETLWMANRDILDRADAPLRPGTLLRTP